jgi:multiple sugar transport system substrate-binding protein
VALVSAVAISSTLLAACGGGGEGGPPRLNYYLPPDNTGIFYDLAHQCAEDSNGQYEVVINPLPTSADGQREQLIRRLAAKDPTVDVMMVDPPYMPEMANAGWLLSLEDDRDELLDGVLDAPIESAEWKGELVGAPYSANTKLLWYRKSVAEKAGVDPTSDDFTWDQMIDAAIQTGTTVGIPGRRYEGYMVDINNLIESAGGSIMENTDKGRDADITINSPEGKKAAEIIRKLATSEAAIPGMSTANEDANNAAFQADDGGFMVNWPYVYPVMLNNVETGLLDQAVLDDVAWARYPRVDANTPSKPPIGGANLAISAYSQHPEESLALVKCLMQPENEAQIQLVQGAPAANGTVYDMPDIRKQFPFADLMRESINDAGLRSVTPFYGDVSSAVTREWSPPESVNPDTTPEKTAVLITDVFQDNALL